MKDDQQKLLRKAKVTDVHRAEAAKLRELWPKRPGQETQAVFGETYGVGNQSAVGQFLRGDAPLSLKAARGFAEGLGCEISAFSPRLAASAASIAAVAPKPVARSEVLSFLNLTEDEARLVGLVRGLKPASRSKVHELALKLYLQEHPEKSAADPFAKPKVKN